MGRVRWIGLVLAGLGVAVRMCHGAPEAYFTSQESVEDKMARLIDGAHFSIDIALFELKSTRLAGTLTQAKERGVRVRLILDAEHARQDLAAGDVRVLGGKNARGRGVMHHKFALFDGREVVTGSFNWTPGAEYANYENALLLDDPQTVSAYSQEFETLWRRALESPPPTGTPAITRTPSPHGKHQHAKEQLLKTIRIKTAKPVRKTRRKAHTHRT